MGVLLDEVVKATRPGHEGPDHVITIKSSGEGARFMPWWTCSCGISGTIRNADVDAALASGAVTRT